MCIAEYFSTLLLQVQFQLNDDNWTRMGGGQGGGRCCLLIRWDNVVLRQHLVLLFFKIILFRKKLLRLTVHLTLFLLVLQLRRFCPVID